MRFLAFYVRLKVTQDREKWTIKLFLTCYIEKLLDCHDILKAKTAKVLMQDTIFFLFNTSALELENIKHAVKVGFIIHVIVEIKIDIAFAKFMVGQFGKNSSSEYFIAINQILQYFAIVPERSNIFGEEKKSELIRYSDSDLAGDYAD